MLYMDFAALVFALFSYRTHDRRLRLLFIHVIVGIIVFSISKYTSSLGNNVYISYLFAPYEAIMLSAILYPLARHKRARILVQIIVSIILIVNILEGTLIEDGFTKYNSYTYVLINILLGTLAIRHLLQLRFDSQIENLARVSMFWVALGLAVKHFAVLIVWAFFKVAQENSMGLLWQLTFIRESVIYLTLILWMIAFWVARKGHYKA